MTLSHLEGEGGLGKFINDPNKGKAKLARVIVNAARTWREQFGDIDLPTAVKTPVFEEKDWQTEVTALGSSISQTEKLLRKNNPVVLTGFRHLKTQMEDNFNASENPPTFANSVLAVFRSSLEHWRNSDNPIRPWKGKNKRTGWIYRRPPLQKTIILTPREIRVLIGVYALDGIKRTESEVTASEGVQSTLNVKRRAFLILHWALTPKSK